MARPALPTARRSLRQEPASEAASERAGGDEGCADRTVAGGAAVYGDAAYGSGAFLDLLAGGDIASGCKTQPPTPAGGLFAKSRFVIDLRKDSVTCPAELSVPIRRGREGDGIAHFGDGCAGCPLRAQCTTAASGRTISVGRYEQRLADARAEQQHPHWVADYRATRRKSNASSGT